MKILTSQLFSDYELIDSGNREKLERFGNFTLIRPEPQALWSPGLNAGQWEKKAHAIFRRTQNASQGTWQGERGEWIKLPGSKSTWIMKYPLPGPGIHFRLNFTSFGHIGVFPEQAPNWDFIFHSVKAMESTPLPKILNLFAYTGVSSLAAAAAGAEVTHVDSVKNVISWARENMEENSFSNVRWIPEDALKYVKREEKRGNQYDGIILDPPAYGRGPTGEKWILEEAIGEMLRSCAKILRKKKGSFILLNLYSLGHSSLIARNLLSDTIGENVEIEYGELVVYDQSKRALPLGIFARMRF